MKKTPRKWSTCPSCFQMVYSSNGIGNHMCPDIVRAHREAELDFVMDEEMSTFEKDLKKFWNDNRTKFYEHLANTKRI